MNLNEQSIGTPAIYLPVQLHKKVHCSDPINDNETIQISWSLDCGGGRIEVVSK